MRFEHLVARRQVGDKIDLGILRAGKPLRVTVELKKYVSLVAPPQPERRPTYLVFGGLVFTVLTVPIDLAGGLGLAVLLNSVLPARGVFRTIIVLPMVISGVASGMIAMIIFYESSGLLNKILSALGLSPVAWQSQGVPAMISVVIVAIWLRVGFNMIIYLAGLQSISPELYEAARIDGASRWQQFRRLTVPLVGPSTFFLLIMNVIASFQVFDLIFVMTGGGPGNATSVLVTYAYRNGFQIREQGYGAAIGIVILLITLAFTFVQWKTSRTRDLVE